VEFETDNLEILAVQSTSVLDREPVRVELRVERSLERHRLVLSGADRKKQVALLPPHPYRSHTAKSAEDTEAVVDTDSSNVYRLSRK